MVTNPETLINEEPQLATEQELGILGKEINKDRKKFEALFKNPELGKGLEKIMEKGLKFQIDNFEKTYNMHNKMSVDEYVGDLIKKRPEMIYFIAGELKLPFKTTKKIKFSQLSYEQKLKFMALVNVVWDGLYKNNQPKTIINNYRKHINKFKQIAAEDFVKKLENAGIFSFGPLKINHGFINLKEFLKKQYNRNDTQFKKLEECIKMIQKHPEYINNLKITKYQEAGYDIVAIGKIIATIVGLLVLGYGIYKTPDIINAIKDLFKTPPPVEVTNVYGGEIKFNELRGVAKALTLEAQSDTIHRSFETDVYGKIPTDSLSGLNKIIGGGKNIVRGIGNTIQGKRKLKLEYTANAQYLFDQNQIDYTFKKNNNNKWTLRIKIKSLPEVKVTDESVKVLENERELLSMDKFKDYELESLKLVRNEFKEKAENNYENIRKAEESLGNLLLQQLKKSGVYTTHLKILDTDIKDFVIEHDYYDPEGKTTRRFN